MALGSATLRDRSGGDPAIALHDVSFTYAGQTRPALDHVDLHVPRGQILAVMGPSAAGKTTLGKLIHRSIPSFHRGTIAGRIELFGADGTDLGVADVAGRVALVAQDFESQLFSTNVLQEVAFGLEQMGVERAAMRERAQRALAAVGLAGFEQRDPSTLSGGEKQRLSIAASLAMDPEILIFDEPTTDLDPEGKQEVLASLAALRAGGKTMILIEHETSAAEIADRLVLLDSGRIVADGPARELLSRVDLLERHAVRPPELATLAHRLNLRQVPASIDEAVDAVRCERSMTARSSSPATVTAARSAPAPIVLDGVHFAYPGGREVLDGVSLSIGAGEYLALLGRNGSGKTTLAKHFNGLLQPQAGSVRIAGASVIDAPPAELAARVGYVFQNPDLQIFADTVREEVRFGPENLGLAPEAVDQRATTTLQAVGLAAVADEDPFVLSKGERQLLAIASLLAMRPQVLVLDEPTTGLDYVEQRRVLDLLAELNGAGMAIVMITHTPWIVLECARRAVVVDSGRIGFDGSLRDFLASPTAPEHANFVAPPGSHVARRLGIEPWSLDGILGHAEDGG